MSFSCWDIGTDVALGRFGVLDKLENLATVVGLGDRFSSVFDRLGLRDLFLPREREREREGDLDLLR
jgi:hypothetical protein